MAFAVMLSYFTELLLGYQMKLHSMRDASMEHDMLMEQMNHQLIEKQNAQIYNATLKERNRIAREIHDNVGHMITRSILQVGAIGVINTDEKLKAPISDLKSTLDTAMDSMRKAFMICTMNRSICVRRLRSLSLQTVHLHFHSNMTVRMMCPEMSSMLLLQLQRKR